MRFNTPQEVVEWATKAAAEDYKKHMEHGVSLNPYSTSWYRNDWEAGWYNRPPYSWEEATRDFDTGFQRGRAARLIWEANL